MLNRLLIRMKTWNNRPQTLPAGLDELPSEMLGGSWRAGYREADRTLVISGKLDGEAERAYLMFNRRLLGVTAVENGSFRFLLQRPGKKGLAPNATFQVATDAGVLPHETGDASWRIFEDLVGLPGKFLDIDKHIDRGDRLTKKGTIAPHTIADVKKARYCKLAAQLEQWFIENHGAPVLVSHGTLLGIYRDNDLVPYDDDFDCLYLSRRTDVAGVVEERLAIATSLLRAGFQCRLGRTGHIKVRNKYVVIDLMPAWIENDVLYVSGYSDIRGASRFVEPPSRLKWQAHGTFSTFARPEIFLEAQYGPNWRVPDPGYRYQFSARCWNNRKQLVPSPEHLAELRRMRDECEQ